jgi:hypothetical protein
MSTPTPNDCEVLVLYPPGTAGEGKDRRMIRTLLELCETHGFGRVPQVTAAIEDIWRNPERLEHYKKLKEKHLELLARARKEAADG